MEEPCRGCRAIVQPVVLPSGGSIRREPPPAGWCHLCGTLYVLASRSIALALGEGHELVEDAMPAVVRAALQGGSPVAAYQQAVADLEAHAPVQPSAGQA